MIGTVKLSFETIYLFSKQTYDRFTYIKFFNRVPRFLKNYYGNKSQPPTASGAGTLGLLGRWDFALGRGVSNQTLESIINYY